VKKSVGVMKYGSMGVENIPSSSTPLRPLPHTPKRSYAPTPLHPHSTTLKPRRGLTLLEIMISVVILSIALTLAWQTFSTATRAWTSGRKAMETMHHGEFVLTQLSSALRSMAFFETSAEKYGFRMEDNSEGFGEHTISWVTASQAFIPRGTVFEHGLHRIEMGGGTDEDGAEGLVVTVWPHLADEEEVEKTSWFITETIKGLRCRAYDTDPDEERWRDDWEATNKIPGLLEITLYADPAREYDSPVEFRQLIEIPLGPPVTNDISAAN